jgi:heme/copper-type cytochrome/quinol oxidase subunit 3
MGSLIAFVVIAVAGFAAYAYLRVTGIGTGGEERLTIVLGTAFALVLRPESPTEFAAELVGLSTVVLGVASIAHLAAVALRHGQVAGVTG